VSNLLAVVAVLGLQGYSQDEISRASAALTNVKGRMDLMPGGDCANVVIDYAHTPDALEKAIKAVRLHSDSDIWCVMGCGGNRDKGKRPEMGEIATRLADHTIITDDNPRDESSEVIIDDILKGAHKDASIRVLADRAEAIEYALTYAKSDDVILIAGKGHEDYQEVNGKRISFSDYVEVEKYLGVQRGDEES
jgi:UDP-N-acetylmuramoyl-L-alanyl-D-glutamate--2,6-diaminopimelate ligase